MPVADCGVFEVGERSEVGALESYFRLGDYTAPQKKQVQTNANKQNKLTI